MTLGLAVPFPGGSILCADSRIEASDASSAGENDAALLSVTSGKRMFAITYAATDPRAGRMLASEIASVACGAPHRQDVVPGIKRVMGDWFRSYGVAQIPSLQFLVASNSTDENSGRVLLCEPPSTVVETGGPFVVGAGARPLTPWLKLLTPRSNQSFSLRSTVLRLTYLTYLARKYEPQSVGDETEMIVLSNRGSFTYIDRRELQQAASLGEKVDILLLDMARQVLSAEMEQNPQTIAEEFLRGYFDVMEQNPQVFFPSLSYLEKPANGPQPIPIHMPTGIAG
ncbi:MAG TPA: hypothetical protein VHX37_10680 [Acidobacteriaceae bacterium]|jgi:hypothetical protein|nr:hypothetical protein [Acidobacteriaceae bacterium]